MRHVFDAPLQSPESRVPTSEHFSLLGFRETRNLFLQQRRCLDGDGRAAALVRGATPSAGFFVAVADARLPRPGDDRERSIVTVVTIDRPRRRHHHRRRRRRVILHRPVGDASAAPRRALRTRAPSRAVASAPLSSIARSPWTSRAARTRANASPIRAIDANAF